MRRELSGDVSGDAGAGAAERVQHGPRLARATTRAAIGCGVFVLLQVVALANYFASGELGWLVELTRPIAPLLYLVVTVAFAALASFFFVFYREATNRPERTSQGELTPD